MPEYAYPTGVELTTIERDLLPTLINNDPIFNWFPMVDKPETVIKWEQKDNITGMQQLRGLGGQPQRINRLGFQDYMYQPGVYGEFADIDETELMNRRPFGALTGFIDISDLVGECQDQLLSRRINRLRWILWTLLTTGAFFVPMPNLPGQPATQGAAGHGDIYNTISGIGQFGFQSFTAGTPWATLSTSAPIYNFRQMQLTATRGRSVSFGRDAVALMNRQTWLDMTRNSNADDFGGQKTTFQSKIIAEDDVNRVMIAADVPQIMIYDEGYIDDNGVFQLWIPNNLVLVIGGRSNGARLGEYRMTRNVVNEGFAPGPYTKVIDNGAGPYPQIVRSIQVHDGHNGGPLIYYPSAIVRMTV